MPGAVMQTVKLKPVSAWGSKCLAAVGCPVEHWVILSEADEVSFSGREGPWWHVYPDVPYGSEYVRWVHATHDKDFQVVK